jgi:hypothetical protein
MRQVTFTATLSGDCECFCYSFSKKEYIRVFGQEKWNEHVQERKKIHEDRQEFIDESEENYPDKGEVFQEPNSINVYETDLHDLLGVGSSPLFLPTPVKLKITNLTGDIDHNDIYNRTRTLLIDIYDRYLHFGDSVPYGRIGHHIACKFYASDMKEVCQKGGFCSCGLLEDLFYLSCTGIEGTAEKIFPKFGEQYGKSFYYKDDSPKPDFEEIMEMFEKSGMKITKITEEEKEQQRIINEIQSNQLILEVFGKEFFDSLI